MPHHRSSASQKQAIAEDCEPLRRETNREMRRVLRRYEDICGAVTNGRPQA